MVIFVEGLFLGIVFFGMWMWKLLFLNIVGFKLNFSVCDFIYESVVIVDFFMIFFSLFVKISCFLFL